MPPRSHSIVIDSSGTIQHLPHTEFHTKGYCYKQEMGYCSHCAESWQGKSLVLTSVLFIAHWLYKKESKVDQLAQFSSSVQLMLSWWRNLISWRVDYQCLVLTKIVHLVSCDFHTRGQYIRSHSTGEDFIPLIVAVFLSEQLKAVWPKFGVLYFRRKRLIGVGSTFTFVENDQGVGLPWHSSLRTLISRHSFLQWSVYSLTGH